MANICPNCGGEFEDWWKAGEPAEYRCPFCGLTRGDYDPEDAWSSDNAPEEPGYVVGEEG